MFADDWNLLDGFTNLTNVFDSNLDAEAANSLPAGWVTFDSDEKRVGALSGLYSGCRILQMTGAQRDFNNAIYIRNKTGNAASGYAKYGSSEGNKTLSLQKGRHLLSFIACNWNCNSQAVKFVLRSNSDNKEVATTTVTPTCNVGNTASNSFSGASQVNLEIEVPAAGNYTLEFYCADAMWSDALFANIKMYQMGTTAGINDLKIENNTSKSAVYYDLSGRRITNPTKGIYIHNGKKIVVK